MNKEWLALTEYSSKYHVSVSTLRRRIRSGQAVHVYKNGKYLLKDLPLVDHLMTEDKKVDREESMIQGEVAPPQQNPPHKKFLAAQAEQKAWATQNSKNNTASKEVETLLAELKSAYRQILQEKEEQVLILKSEISDLRTLAKVLETENERLRRS